MLLFYTTKYLRGVIRKPNSEEECKGLAIFVNKIFLIISIIRNSAGKLNDP